eukprot:7093908-Pyramimonas_sp.AAC.1
MRWSHNKESFHRRMRYVTACTRNACGVPERRGNAAESSCRRKAWMPMCRWCCIAAKQGKSAATFA